MSTIIQTNGQGETRTSLVANDGYIWTDGCRQGPGDCINMSSQ